MISNASTSIVQSGLTNSDVTTKVPQPDAETDIGLRFEQMLWAEMLTHTGLEDALTKNGGEAAAAFSRFVVESIAADIAEKHPLGLSAGAQPAADGVNH